MFTFRTPLLLAALSCTLATKEGQVAIADIIVALVNTMFALWNHSLTWLVLPGVQVQT